MLDLPPGSQPHATTGPTAPTVLHARAAPGDAGDAAPEPAGEPFGRYRLLHELGRGGMGVVYKAWDRELRREVALKTLLPHHDADALERFAREARAAAQLRHPNIVQVHDVGSVEGRHYFTMDYVQGKSLEAARAELPIRRFLEILRDVALALHAAHEAGIVHRDMKPANVLLDAAGRPFVGDFGLAKQVQGAEEGMTATGAVMGTPHYMSPEQAGGDVDRIGPASDVWSLGVMLYEQLAGRKPFDAPSPIALLVVILSRDPEPPSRVAAAAGRGVRIHRDLDTVCLRCLEKEPARRYASAGALAADLGHLLDSEPIDARPATLAYRARTWLGRRKKLVAAVALVAFAAALSAAYVLRAAHEVAAARARDLARKRAQEAVEASRDARGESRLHLLEAALAPDADPGCFEALLLRARSRWWLGRLPDALADVDRALVLRPADHAARLLRFRLLCFGFANNALALADLDAVAADCPEPDASLAAEGLSAWKEGRLDRASELLGQARLGEDVPTALALGYRAWATGRIEPARACFAWAERLAPEAGEGKAGPFVGMRWCALAEGESVSPEDWFADAERLDPENPEAWILRVFLLFDQGAYPDLDDLRRRAQQSPAAHLGFALDLAEVDPSEAVLDCATQLLPGPEALVAGLRRTPPPAWDPAPARRRLRRARAEQRLQAGRATEARALLAELAADGARDWRLEAGLAALEGKPDLRRECLEKAAAEGDVSASAEVGALLLREGRTPEAEQAFDRALAPTGPVGEAVARDLRRCRQDRDATLIDFHGQDDPGPRLRTAIHRPERFLARILRRYPRCAPALASLADLRMREGRAVEALADFDRAVLANPRCVEAWLGRGCALRDFSEIQDLERAEADLREAGRLEPAAARVRLETGVLALRRNRHADALAAADAVLATPAPLLEARARRLRADALARLGRADEAREEQERWGHAAEDPAASAFAYRLGTLAWDAQRFENAATWYDRAVESAPRCPRCLYVRGKARLKTSAYAEGYRDTGEAVRRSPRWGLAFLQKTLEVKDAQPWVAPLAAEAMAQCAARYPHDPGALYVKALTEVLAGKCASACALLDRIVALDPAFTYAFLLRGLARLRCGELPEAEADLRRAAELAPRDELLHLLQACHRVKAGDLDGASRALSAIPTSERMDDDTAMRRRTLLGELRELAPLRESPRYRALLGRK